MLVHLAHAERDMDERMEVAPARLEQQHARRAVLAQAIGQHAAGRTGADDDVVVACLHVSTFRCLSPVILEAARAKREPRSMSGPGLVAVPSPASLAPQGDR